MHQPLQRILGKRNDGFLKSIFQTENKSAFNVVGLEEKRKPRQRKQNRFLQIKKFINIKTTAFR